jgi:DNA helicase-2/ATP-dependent DNA helicase PcrA
VPSSRADTGLNDQQREAVEHADAPLLLLAGAGTGKTRVVTCRVAHLVATGNAAPAEILALTFTNRAAREMRERAVTLEPRLAGAALLGTFHSTCARWLRRWAPRAGLSPDFSIYDDDDQRALLRHVVGQLGLADDAASIRSYAARIEEAKNEALRIHEVEERARGPHGERVASVFAAYQTALREANACDFADLVAHVVHILQDDPVLREAVQGRWPRLLVDEFQDTNVAQYLLLKQLASPSSDVMVVGDDDQSIYRWRGATVENVRRFADEFGARVLALEENYRSTQTILDAAHAVVERLPHRFDKRLRTSRRDTEPVTVYVANDDRREAEFVAKTIAELRAERGLDWSNFAVFYRTNAQSRLFEEQLRARHVPHAVVGGLAFFERREVRDLLAYVRVAVNPADDVAFRRIANVPTRGIGKGTLDAIEVLRRQRGLPHMRAALAVFAASPPPRTTRATRAGLARLHEILTELEALAPRATAAELLEGVLQASGYEEWLRDAEPHEADDRMRNVGELLSSARAFVAPDDATAGLAPFLEHVALREAEASEHEGSAGAVSLMTVHAAKGLEFRVVFATGLEDGQFPLQRRGAVLDEHEAAEERRLWYVAVTRARDRLFVTAAMRRATYGTPSSQRPSPFLLELATQHVREIGNGLATWRADDGYGGAAFQRASSFGRGGWDEYDQRVSDHVPEAGVVFDDSYYPAAAAESARGYVGKRVRHATFGMGQIVAADPSGDRVRLTIQFPDAGVRKVVAQFVEILD